MTRRALALLLAVAASAGEAASLDPIHAGVQVCIGEKTVLGRPSFESFREYDFTASFRTPLEYAISPRWSGGARLLLDAGVLQASGHSTPVAAAIPILALGTRDGAFAVDAGAGFALLGKHRFAAQDFGGPLQFALTFGVDVPLYRRIGAGYRFVHYSDAAAYGGGTTGADLHFAGLFCRFAARR